MNLHIIRTIIAFGGALVAALVLGKPFLYALRRLGLGQHIREEGPQSHQKKAGTPTIGGIIILTALSITLIAMGALKGHVLWAFGITLGYGLLGLLDDLLSITKGRNMGLKARQKLLGQIILAVLLVVFAMQQGMGENLPFPFLRIDVTLGAALFFVVALIAMVGTSNGVNLADGLDGLAGGTVAVAAMSQALLSLLFQQYDMAIFAAAIAGSCLGFLWFNAHPALVIMGDTGALALGGALAAAGLLSKTTFFLPLVVGIFLVENLSVMLQVASFQLFHRRIFRMSPLHHHYELGGLAEEKVVSRFWLAGILFGLVSVLSAWPYLRAMGMGG